MTTDRTFRDEERARELWQEGMQELLEGRIQSAVDCFNQSLLIVQPLKGTPTEDGRFRSWECWNRRWKTAGRLFEWTRSLATPTTILVFT